MAGTLIRRVLLQITADDGDTEAKLDKISLKADELAAKHPDLKVRIDTAAAQAKVAVLREELRGLSRQADEEAAKGGILSRLLGGLNSGLAGGLSKIPGIPDISGEGGLPVTLGALGAIVDAAAAASTELTGLVSGFAAAGAGLGAFGLLALPTFKSISNAYTQINADQQAYNRALTATARNTALAHLKQDYASLSGPTRAAVMEIQNLQHQFDILAKQYAPEVTGLFSQVIGIASDYGPKILDSLAKPVFPALSGLLANVDKELSSKGFSNWLKQFSSLEGPSLTAIGTGVGHLANNIGRLLTLMSAKDVVNSINIAFSAIDGVLVGFIQFVHYTMVTWDALTTAWDKSVSGVRRGGHDMAEGFDTARHASASFGHGAAHVFDDVRHGAATAAHGTASAFDRVRGAVAGQLEGVERWVKDHWKAVASFLADPIATAVFEIRTHTHQIAAEFDRLRHDAAAILAGMRHDTAAEFDQARHDAAAAMAGMRHDVAGAWDRLRHDAATWGDDMLHAVERAWDSMFGSTKRGGAQVTGYVGSLPGRITSLLARLPGDMLAIGRNTILGLIHGIESAAASIPSIMKGLAGDVEHYFTDPLSIFSPSRVMFEHGRMVPAGVALGIEAGLPRIRQASAKMAQAVNPAGLGAGAHGTAAGGGRPGVLQLEVVGNSNDLLVTLLKKNIRLRGGDPSVLGA